MVKAFRKFVKVAIKKRNRTLATQILEAVKVPKDSSKEMPLMQRIMLGYEKAPTIDEIRCVAEAITDIGAKLAFILLAETGLRPPETSNFTIVVDAGDAVYDLEDYNLTVVSFNEGGLSLAMLSASVERGEQ
ncbi:hypothetical protein Igag_1258 [Ignisphaera aggregans DSM 17230]|uniref:Uncharacterized protein n=1 Tax=Ignisphaera aggregans (strain DSM 17230 / JCM 13409 / AQ1.S1) TaxID=583356 RepID=E0SPK8_IGNAA|nr:hypothetical protein Igag_1258 [Ignisphaera aggregans DSM 17230]